MTLQDIPLLTTGLYHKHEYIPVCLIILKNTKEHNELKDKLLAWIKTEKDPTTIPKSLMTFYYNLKDYPQFVSLLMDAGADPFIRDYNNKRPPNYIDLFTNLEKPAEQKNDKKRELESLIRELTTYIQRADDEIKNVWFTSFFGLFTFDRKPNQKLNKQTAERLKEDLEIILATGRFDKLSEFANKAHIDNLRGGGTIHSNELNGILDKFYRLNPSSTQKAGLTS